MFLVEHTLSGMEDEKFNVIFEEKDALFYFLGLIQYVFRDRLPQCRITRTHRIFHPDVTKSTKRLDHMNEFCIYSGLITAGEM